MTGRPPAGVALLAAGAFAIGTDAFLVAPLVPRIAADLGTAPAVAGQLVTAFTLSYALAAPLAAVLTGRRPARGVLIGGLALFCLGTVLTAAAGSFPVALLGRVLAAAGAAAYGPRAFALAARLVPAARRGSALAAVTAGLSLATALGLPAGAYVGATLSWRVALLAVAGLGAAVAAGCLALPRLDPQPAGSPGPLGLAAYLHPLRDRAVLAVLATTLLALAGEYVAYTAVGTLTADAVAGRAAVLPGLLLAFGVAAVAGSMLSGRATDRWGSRPVLLVALAALTVCLAGLGRAAGSVPSAVLALAAFGLAGWAFMVPQQHRLVTLAGPTGPALLLSLNSSVLYLGAALGAAASGPLLTWLGPRGLTVAAAVPAAAAVVVGAYAHRTPMPAAGRRAEAPRSRR